MIRQIRITDWRAYENLDLELDAPVVFVVAPNGVGKSSLNEAVRWGLFGKFARKSGRPVRLGAKEATVRLAIELEQGSVVDVSRSLTAAGKASFSASIGESSLTEAEFMERLESTWGADEDLLFALLFGDSGSNASSSFPVRDHLADIFGVTPLREAVAEIDNRARTLKREIEDLRAERVDEKAIREAEIGVEELTAEVNEQAAELEGARETVKGTEVEKQAALSWERFRTQLAEYEGQISELVQRLADVSGDEPHDDDPHEAVGKLEDEATATLDQTRHVLSEEQVKGDSATNALQLLTDDVEVCPTCLRPITEAERTFARNEHERTHGDAERDLSASKDAIREAEKTLATIRTMGRELREIRTPAPPSTPDPGADALENARQAQERLEAANELHGAALARLNDAKQRLELLLRAASENQALVAAYREEITLQIAREVFSEVINHYMRERIEPLTGEVSRRSKLLFGSEGLRLEPDGTLSFHTDAGELELSDLSGGERVMALFIARLLLVSAASRATTLWLDEPLEHLDPRRRAIVAATVVKAAEQGALKQVVVTTYEERLVRQLAATAPEQVQIAHVRTFEPNF